MQAPPAFTPPAPRQGKSPMTIVLIVLGVFALCCVLPVGTLVGGGAFLFNKFKGVGECFADAGLLENSLEMYVKKNGKLPKAETWQTDLKPFLKKAIESGDTGPFKLIGPEDKEWGCTQDGVNTYFVFNKDVSGKKPSEVKDADIPAIFESSTGGPNANRKYEPQPFTQSPKVGDKNRGWIVVLAQVPSVAITVKDGTVSRSTEFNFSAGARASVKDEQDKPASK